MRVLVDDVLHSKHRAGLLQMLGDHLIGCLSGQSCKLPCLFGELAVAVHRHHNGQVRIMVAADLKVLHTVSGSRMHAARAAFQGDMVA